MKDNIDKEKGYIKRILYKSLIFGYGFITVICKMNLPGSEASEAKLRLQIRLAYEKSNQSKNAMHARFVRGRRPSAVSSLY